MLESMCLDQVTEMYGRGEPSLQTSTWSTADESLATSGASSAGCAFGSGDVAAMNARGASVTSAVPALTLASMPMAHGSEASLPSQPPAVVTSSQPQIQPCVALAELLHHFPDLPSFILHTQFPEFSRVWVEFQRQISIAKEPHCRPAVQDWLRSAISHLSHLIWQLHSEVSNSILEDCEASSRFMQAAYRRLKERMEVMQELFQIIENGRMWLGQEPHITIPSLLKAITTARQDTSLHGTMSPQVPTTPVEDQQTQVYQSSYSASSASSFSSYSSTTSLPFSPDPSSTPLPWSQASSIKAEEEDPAQFPEEYNHTIYSPTFCWSQQGQSATAKHEHDESMQALSNWESWCSQPTSMVFQVPYFVSSTSTMPVPVPMTTVVTTEPLLLDHQQPLQPTPVPMLQLQPLPSRQFYQREHEEERPPQQENQHPQQQEQQRLGYPPPMPDCIHPTVLIQPTATWSVPVTPSEHHPRQVSYFWSCPTSPHHEESEKDGEDEDDEAIEEEEEDLEMDDDKDEDYQASTASEEEDEDGDVDLEKDVKHETSLDDIEPSSQRIKPTLVLQRSLLDRPSRQHRQYTRRTATSYDAQTTHYLKSVFFNIYSKRDKLTKEQRREVQQHTGLKPRNITYWFSNHKRRFQTSLRIFKQTVRESGGRVKTYDDFLRWRRMRGLPDEVMEVETQSGKSNTGQ